MAADASNAIIVGVVITEGVVVVGFFITDVLARRRELAVRLAERKHTVTLNMMKALQAGVQAATEKRQPTAEELQRVNDAAREALLVSSDRVVKQWQKLQQLGTRNASQGDVFRQYGRYIAAMRRDMGHARTRLGPREVLRTMIVPSEWDKIDDALKR